MFPPTVIYFNIWKQYRVLKERSRLFLSYLCLGSGMSHFYCLAFISVVTTFPLYYACLFLSSSVFPEIEWAIHLILSIHLFFLAKVLQRHIVAEKNMWANSLQSDCGSQLEDSTLLEDSDKSDIRPSWRQNRNVTVWQWKWFWRRMGRKRPFTSLGGLYKYFRHNCLLWRHTKFFLSVCFFYLILKLIYTVTKWKNTTKPLLKLHHGRTLLILI